jgi:hypothetical protein
MKIFKWLLGNDKDESKEVKAQDKNLEIIKDEIEHEAICPYCKTVLKKFPIRKTKCFNCGENIHILKFNSYKEKKLITENEKLIHEAEEKRTSFRTRWLADLQRFGIKEHDFNDRKEQFLKKTGIRNNDNDVIWSFFNELVFKNHSNFNQLPMLYYSMALFVHEEGKDNFYLLKEFAISTLHKLELENLNSDLTIMVEIVSGSNSCDNCKKTDGLRMTIRDALLNLPIPCKECNHSIGFCRCYYVAIPIRDEEGMLILKK